MMEFNGKGQKWATYFDHFLNFSQFCHAKVLVNLTKKTDVVNLAMIKAKYFFPLLLLTNITAVWWCKLLMFT